MIEIKIPTGAASYLITEKMQVEFESRKKNGFYGRDLEIVHLNYREIQELAEIAAYDLVMTLPYKVLLEKNNLPQILCKTIRSLSKIYICAELEKYDLKRAEKIIVAVREFLIQAEEEKNYLIN